MLSEVIITGTIPCWHSKLSLSWHSIATPSLTGKSRTACSSAYAIGYLSAYAIGCRSVVGGGGGVGRIERISNNFHL